MSRGDAPTLKVRPSPPWGDRHRIRIAGSGGSGGMLLPGAASGEG
jgi:hypothetical protein